VEWIELAQDWVQWRGPVKDAQFPDSWGSSLQERFCSMDLISSTALRSIFTCFIKRTVEFAHLFVGSCTTVLVSRLYSADWWDGSLVNWKGTGRKR
jgi:hypothetical protein